MSYQEIQLTHAAGGHCLNTTQCFSPDDQWIVYDNRNDDTQLASNGTIAAVHSITGEIKILYRTDNQTVYGPGAGAATFSPAANRVLFLHGIRNAAKDNPYSFTRRTGVAIDMERPLIPLFLDARDITPPYTPGALRGGTHAHTWSGDGQWISFTYNDYVIEQAARSDAGIHDLRTVGILVPGPKVIVDKTNGPENNDGEMVALPVAVVTEHPAAGTDEIDKAFDECWIGENGYQRTDGSRQHRAIAFQGNVRDNEGRVKTEIFVADIPDTILQAVLRQSVPEGIQRLPVPPGITQRRITFTGEGVSGPRHWLRTTKDGSLIAFLAKDSRDIVQLFAVSPNGGAIVQLTHNPFPVQGPFNWSPDGRRIAYPADNSVFITDITNGDTQRITPRRPDEERPIGAVCWSRDGSLLCYNRYVSTAGGRYLQIFLLKER
ncbi:MAG: DUF3748 domain-containing protein [Chitinophagaceae bacterium]